MKIQEYLKEQGVPFEEHQHPPAYTAQEIAAEEHVSGNILAKPVTVKAGKSYAMCVLPASYKLDMKKVAKAIKTRKVRLADENEMAKLFPDSEVGAEPPFGILYELPTLVDEHLVSDTDIVFQGGTHRLAIRMKYADYARLVQPTVADLAVHL
jgi:Ala-tRNA(Pro) deacylase